MGVVKTKNTPTGFDIIGDVQGEADLLEVLLKELGYEYRRRRGYAHLSGNRQVIFVGDYINKGYENQKTLSLIRQMVDNDQAIAIMGNHEFREIVNDMVANDENYRGQRGTLYGTFAQEVRPDTRKYKKWVEWFRTLPVFYEVDGHFTVLHAQYRPSSIDLAEDYFLDKQKRLKPDSYNDYLNKNRKLHSTFHRSVGMLLWGTKIDVPEALQVKNSVGLTQKFRRICWWRDPSDGIEAILNMPEGSATEEQKRIFAEVCENTERWKAHFVKPQDPVFCGHIPRARGHVGRTNHEHVACMDVSEGLAAYRYHEKDGGRLVNRRVVHVMP